jgi:integrase/recombinase XerD
MEAKTLLSKKLTTLPKFAIYLDERLQKSDGTYPVKIRASLLKTRKYYPIKANSMNQLLKESPSDLSEFTFKGTGDYSLSKEVYEKVTNPKSRGKYQLVYQIFSSLINEANEIANNCRPFSFEQFKVMYIDDNGIKQNSDVLQTFRNYISKLNKQGRIRTAVSYGCTLSSIEGFYDKKTLPFEAITISFLEKYDKWMKDYGKSGKGNSKTTIGFNMRQLRAIFNMRPNELEALPYPFGEKKYEIPKSKGRKIALDNSDLKRVFDYKPAPGTIDEYYLDFWKLQYLMNGINLTDLLLLKQKNVQNGFIEFERHKTARTKKESLLIRIPLSPDILEILDRRRMKPASDNSYLLPLLNGKTTDIEKDKSIINFAQAITVAMKKISKKLELGEDIQKKISTYSSRHSFASQLMKKGASVAYIQKQLGHTNLETTTNYLSSFEDKDLQEWQGKLTEF